MRVVRRSVGAVSVVTCLLVVGVAFGPAASATGTASAPGAPAGGSVGEPSTPIEHVVTVMQEGHTFDNYFGTYPGAAGPPANVCMPVKVAATPCVRPFPLESRPLRDLDHGAAAQRTAYADGAMNGFVRAQSRNGVTDDQTMGTYDRSSLSYYWNVADSFVLFDHFFSSSPGGSLANHLSWVTGTAGGATGESVPTEGYGALPTIFDRLQSAGVSWKFYVQNYDPTVTFRRAPGAARGAQVTRVPLLAYARYVDDPALFAHIVPVSQYFEDLHAGKLPAVSYIVPSGPSERSPTSVRSGERFVQGLVGALAASRSWSSSAFMLTYDGWGGYYDHMAPVTIGSTTTGFRVPTLLVSAYARRGVVDHTQLDTTSILRFIEQNWNLPPLGAADAQATGLASAFAFDRAPRPAEVVSPGQPASRAEPARIGLVLALYGLAFFAALMVLVAIAWRARRRAEVVLP